MPATLQTEEMILNVGPQHPSTHGVLRVLAKLDGEVVRNAGLDVGYLHRGIEKLAESRTYAQVTPYTDRLDYLAAVLNNLGYVETVEKLAGIEVPLRAQYLRVIAAELSRIASHLVFVATYCMDLGAVTGFFYPFRDRERILDLFEMLCGGRITINYPRLGGVAADPPEEFFPALEAFLEDLPQGLTEYHQLITKNEIFLARTRGVGVIDPERALDYGLSGPVLRACGIPYDLRRLRPYEVYDRLDFAVPVGERGDCYNRYLVRLREIEESARLIRQAVDRLPEGEARVKPKVVRPAEGAVYHEIEGAKGVLGYYLVSDGSTKPYRLHIRGPSFINLAILEELVRDCTIADLIAILGSFDICLGEVDR